jgi:hypothetical protein
MSGTVVSWRNLPPAITTHRDRSGGGGFGPGKLPPFDMPMSVLPDESVHSTSTPGGFNRDASTLNWATVRAMVGDDVEYASHASLQRTGTVSRFADSGGFAFLAAAHTIVFPSAVSIGLPPVLPQLSWLEPLRRLTERVLLVERRHMPLDRPGPGAGVFRVHVVHEIKDAAGPGRLLAD